MTTPTQPPYPPQEAYANAGTYRAPQPLWEHDARTISTLTHVSAFFFPFLGPLVAYLVFRGRSLLVEHHAKEQMNLAISLFIYAVGGIVASVLTLGIALLVVVPAMVVVPIAAFILTIVAAVSASRGEYYRFPFILRFIH
jgi:uncharacterized protein